MVRKRVEPVQKIGIDEQAFELLSENVKVQQEAVRIAQQTLTTNRLNARLAVDVLERYAHQGEQLADAIACIKESAALVEELGAMVKTLDVSMKSYAGIVRELIDEISKRFDRFERSISLRLGRLEEIELVQLSGEPATHAKATDWRNQLIIERIQRELKQHYMNLSELRESAARYGMTVPLDTLNAIKYTERTIAALESQLEDLRNATTTASSGI